MVGVVRGPTSHVLERAEIAPIVLVFEVVGSKHAQRERSGQEALLEGSGGGSEGLDCPSKFLLRVLEVSHHGSS